MMSYDNMFPLHKVLGVMILGKRSLHMSQAGFMRFLIKAYALVSINV
jgi:hypothetical protein